MCDTHKAAATFATTMFRTQANIKWTLWHVMLVVLLTTRK